MGIITSINFGNDLILDNEKLDITGIINSGTGINNILIGNTASNFTEGSYNIAGGTNTIITNENSSNNFAYGLEIDIQNSTNCIALGQGIKISNSTNTIIMGQYNDNTRSDILFGIGNGNNSSNRKNAFSITGSGDTYSAYIGNIEDSNLLQTTASVNNKIQNFYYNTDRFGYLDNKLDNVKLEKLENGLFELTYKEDILSIPDYDIYIKIEDEINIAHNIEVRISNTLDIIYTLETKELNNGLYRLFTLSDLGLNKDDFPTESGYINVSGADNITIYKATENIIPENIITTSETEIVSMEVEYTDGETETFNLLTMVK